MRDFFTLYTLLAFALGVFLSGWVMSLIGRARGRGKTASA